MKILVACEVCFCNHHSDVSDNKCSLFIGESIEKCELRQQIVRMEADAKKRQNGFDLVCKEMLGCELNET